MALFRRRVHPTTPCSFCGADVRVGAAAYLRARKLEFFVPRQAPGLLGYDLGVILPLSERV